MLLDIQNHEKLHWFLWCLYSQNVFQSVTPILVLF